MKLRLVDADLDVAAALRAAFADCEGVSATIHVEYWPNVDRIRRITVMRNDVVP